MKRDVRAAIMNSDGNRILVLECGGCWELPGGEPGFGEEDTDFLRRRVAEQIHGTTLKPEIELYRDFTTPEYVKGRRAGSSKTVVYRAGIEKMGYHGNTWFWYSTAFAGIYRFSDMTDKIIKSLAEDGCVKDEF